MNTAQSSTDSSQAKPLSARAIKMRERKLELEQAERERQAREKAEHQAWLQHLPVRLLALMAVARKEGGQVVVTGDVDLATLESAQLDDLRHLRVEIVFSGHSDSSIDVDVGFDIEPWEFGMAVSKVQTLIDQRLEREAKLTLARQTYDSLTPAQRDALGLKSRP